MERWKAVPGYEGSYEVSDEGRVRSLTRRKFHGHRHKGRMLRQPTMPRGYKVVTLWRDATQKTALVHRLVLLAFVGEAPTGAEALHADGDPANNSLENLSWGTHSDNQFDQVAHGTHHHSSKTHCVRGHEFTPENTYNYPGRNHRACRKCRKVWSENHQKRTAAA
ncbi:NUMOD4 motif-containing HNH endonuclease [Gordonia sp. ABSL49_1]|uniref:NUMOD4 motif-containing HNH endonuclease n=1 Tax=Gordonia sp. ABSL49_1 TaxID=2920941 RepID=UPI0035B27CC2